MGNSCQKSGACQNTDGCCCCHESLFVKDFVDNYRLLNTVHDSRCAMGQVYCQKNNKNQYVCLIQKDVNQNQISIIQQKIKLRHTNILKFFDFEYKEKCCNCCNHLDTISLYMEWYDQNLEKEIQQRKLKETLFSEESLWYLILTCVEVLIFQQSRKIVHEDIQPINIFLNPRGEIFLSDQVLLNYPGETYFNIKNKIGGSYPAPEVFYLNQKDYNNRTYDQLESNIFSLGLTVLSAASLTLADKVYDYKNLQIFDSKINEMIQMIHGHYSQHLIEVINQMLTYHVNQRIRLYEIRDYIRSLDQNLIYTTMYDRKELKQNSKIIHEDYLPNKCTTVI